MHRFRAASTFASHFSPGSRRGTGTGKLSPFYDRLGLSFLRGAAFCAIILLCILPSACNDDSQKGQPLEGIVLIVGDGMGLSLISQASLEKGTALNLDSMPVVGLQKTSSATGSVTDSAAAITAILAGKKTYNEWIGIDTNGNPIPSIFEIAKERHWNTAIISTSSVTHATPAGAFAHVRDRDSEESIARQIAENPPDILIGGGRNYFLEGLDVQNQHAPESPIEMLRKTHSISLSYSDFMKSSCDSLCIDGESVDRIVALLADNHLPPVDPSHKLNYKKDSDSPSTLKKDSIIHSISQSDDLRIEADPLSRRGYLKLASVRSLRTLQGMGGPFLMLIEGSQIDWGGHANKADYAITELRDLDETLGALLKELEGRNVLIVVTADHETGGHAVLSGKPGEEQKVGFLTHEHSAEMVPVFAHGPGAETFSGIYENTEIFHKLLAVMEATPAISH